MTACPRSDLPREQLFDYLYGARGAGVYTLTIHPDVHGKPHMVPLLDDLIEYVKGHDGVEFVTHEEVARRYLNDPSVYGSESEFV